MNHPHIDQLTEYLANLNRQATSAQRLTGKLLGLFAASVALNLLMLAAFAILWWLS